MKKILAVLAVLALVFLLCSCSRSNVSSNASVTLNFKGISITLTDEEAAKVLQILDGKVYDSFLSGVPSCGFDKSVSFQVGLQTFAVAMDTCNCIYDLTSLKYFDVTEEEITYIHELFEKYGGHFPCI